MVQIYKTIQVPLPRDVGKLEAREILYAVEELYFFGRFAEAVTFLEGVFRDGAEGLDYEVRGTLEYYRKKCEEKTIKCTDGAEM